jgi:hypothetical protein
LIVAHTVVEAVAPCTSEHVATNGALEKGRSRLTMGTVTRGLLIRLKMHAQRALTAEDGRYGWIEGRKSDVGSTAFASWDMLCKGRKDSKCRLESSACTTAQWHF